MLTTAARRGLDPVWLVSARRRGAARSRSHLDMLASYPRVAGTLPPSKRKLRWRACTVDRLLCTADAVPFGVGAQPAHRDSAGLQPGHADAPVFDLVGAYDIGHPAAAGHERARLGTLRRRLDRRRAARRAGSAHRRDDPRSAARSPRRRICPSCRCCGCADLARELHASRAACRRARAGGVPTGSTL